MVRAICQHVALDTEGNIQANKTVAFLEDDGTTPYAGNIYDVSSGGAPVTSHSTNSVGLIQRWVEPNNARPCKLTVQGASVQTQSAFYIDPSTVVTLTGTQTLTNKTLTSPVITGGTYDTFYQVGPDIFNVRAYGAVGDGSTNDTAAILAARAAIVAQWANATYYAGVLYFPPGAYLIDEPLVFQGMYGVTIRGAGPNVSILKIKPRTDDWAGLHVVSLANSSNCSIEHMDIRNTAAGTGDLPDTLVFWAQGTGNGSNANRFENVRLQGAVRRALFYNYAVPSSSVNEVDFYLEASNQAILDNDTADTAAVILTRDNVLGLTAANGLSLLTPGTGSVSDIVFHECEIHDIIAQSRTAAGTDTASTLGQALWLDEAYEIKVIGGNISSAGARYVRLTGAAVGASNPGIGCRDIKFDGVTFYSEGATATTALFPLLGVSLDTAPVSVTSPTTAVKNLTIVDCYIPCRGSTATAAVIHGVQAATFYAPTLRKWSTQASYTGRALSGAGAGIVVEDLDIEANSFAVIFGASGTSTRGERLHYATSTITSSLETHGQQIMAVGGPISLSGGNIVYLGLGTGASATEINVQTPVSQTCRFRNLRLNVTAQPGAAASGKKHTVTLNKNGSATAITFEIFENVVTARDIAHSVNFAEGDLFSIKVEASATATTTAAVVGTISRWDG